MQYFIYDPNDKAYFYKTEDEWQKAMDEYDFLGNYCDDGWEPEVENVIAGQIPDDVRRIEDEDNEQWEDEWDFLYRYITHRAQPFDEQSRPDDVDENGFSSDGTYWGEWDFICNYGFEKEPANANK